MPREAMALKAVVEPMLIIDRRIVMQNETITAFRGISQPGRTWNFIVSGCQCQFCICENVQLTYASI